MAHPVVFWPKPFFYALGNTPAICLTANLPPEETANILLLGCGDPRNILYTISSAGPNAIQELDITCCDIDVAVLGARNIVLLTLLAESAPQQHIWDIFYDLYLDNESQSLLSSHCRALCEISDTVEHWHSERYGFFLRMCTAETLWALRRHWRLYADFHQMSPAQKKQFKAKFTESKEKIRTAHDGIYNATAARNAGPLWAEYISSHNHGQLWIDYWETGLTTKTSKKLAAKMMPNPTYIYSLRGHEFALHYGTNPVLGFHLAHLFAPTKPANKASGTTLASGVTDPAIACAKEQFDGWCDSFKARIHPKDNGGAKLSIRFFVGEVLALCKTLRAFGITRKTTTGLYSAPWKLSQLELNGGDYAKNAPRSAPTLFNVIDTSNLVDHLGLLNILLCTVPLLSRTPSSALYTETLVSSGSDPTIAFSERLCGDIPLMSVLFGVVPSTYISKFTTTSNLHDVLMSGIETNRQFHERLAWKIPHSCSPAATSSYAKPTLVFEPHSLAQFLFTVYHKMFGIENPTMLFNLSPKTVGEASILHYSRESFVHFLAMVKESATTDWTRTVEDLLEMVRSDRRLLLSMNCYQDMITHMYMQQVYESPILTQDTAKLDVGRIGRFKDWSAIPPIVCVTLVIPRQTLKPLFEDNVGSPLLMCEIFVAGGHNIFSGFHPAFATVKSTDNRVIELNEDPAGWFGSSPLIASFWVPSANLLLAPERTVMKLSIKITPQTARLVSKLGLGLSLYEVKLQDEEHVLLSEGLPMVASVPTSASLPPESGRTLLITDASFELNPTIVNLGDSHTKISTLGVKVDILDSDLKSKLADGATVSTTQQFPCAITLSVGTTKKVVPFIYPVDQSRVKLRIARKSSYIEILAPISDLVHNAAGAFHSFPVIVHNKHPSVWNIHYLNLDSLPRLDTGDARKMEWLQKHMIFTFSVTERTIREEKVQCSESARLLPSIKDSLVSFVYHAAGIQSPRRYHNFGLSHPGRGGIYALIIVTDICLDLASHTVVMDACILPLTVTLVQNLQPVIVKLQDEGLVVINTDTSECDAWQHLIPAFTERCRTWKHRNSCEYLTKGIPVTRDLGKSPLCNCAPGNASAEFKKVPQYRPLVKYVTRAAISPFFAVSYLETIFSKDMPNFGEKPEGGDGCRMCGKGGKLLRCAGCRNVHYCSVDCQKAHWKVHKKECRKK